MGSKIPQDSKYHSSINSLHNKMVPNGDTYDLIGKHVVRDKASYDENNT